MMSNGHKFITSVSLFLKSDKIFFGLHALCFIFEIQFKNVLMRISAANSSSQNRFCALKIQNRKLAGILYLKLNGNDMK